MTNRRNKFLGGGAIKFQRKSSWYFSKMTTTTDDKLHMWLFFFPRLCVLEILKKFFYVTFGNL